MSIVLLIIVGAAAGLIATRVMDIEANLLETIAIGVLGALIGGLVLRFMLSLAGAAFGFVGAIVGAILLIWLYQTYIR